MERIETQLLLEAGKTTDPTVMLMYKLAAQTILCLRGKVARLTDRANRYDALEAAGVDSWDGYHEAMTNLYATAEEEK